jgi:hypothetical protein
MDIRYDKHRVACGGDEVKGNCDMKGGPQCTVLYTDVLFYALSDIQGRITALSRISLCRIGNSKKE